MIQGTGQYQTGISDLRVLLSDQGDDRYIYRHRCFGPVNGTNIQFKTFFRRRVTNFTAALTGGEGVYVDNVQVLEANIVSDDVETGELFFASGTGTSPALSGGFIPQDGSVVEASYYYQWFDDNELDTFLQQASRWLQSNNDYTTTNPGLIEALIKYAASQCYTKMAQRWRQYMSQDYRVEDAPKDSPTYNTNEFLELAKYFRAEALATRTEFYETRQGRALQPLFGSIRGRVRSLGTGSDN
jgi:hypothetical protein